MRRPRFFALLGHAPDVGWSSGRPVHGAGARAAELLRASRVDLTHDLWGRSPDPVGARLDHETPGARTRSLELHEDARAHDGFPSAKIRKPIGDIAIPCGGVGPS